MLLSLAIRDVVLIEALDLTFTDGLCVLTGETGAGKSILLDALGLALGVRAEAGLVRVGAERATVTAVFELPPDHPALALLAGHDLADAVAPGEPLVLRRQLATDGRSRAFVNDRPVGVALLRTLGTQLCEVMGQGESQGLLDPTTHRVLLDAFGGLGPAGEAVAAAWKAWRAAGRAATEAREAANTAATDRDYLAHALEELDRLAPRPGEERLLADERAARQQDERLLEVLQTALEHLTGGESRTRGSAVAEHLHAAAAPLARVAPKAAGRLDGTLDALDRAAEAVAEAERGLIDLVRGMPLDPRQLEQVEERLFALRACARKHQVTVDSLADLRDQIARRLALADDAEGAVARATAAAAAAREAYRASATALSEARRVAGAALDRAVATELPPLKLERAVFSTQIIPAPEPEWGETGIDRIAFAVAANPGSAPGPLARTASGGELARFLLALKVVLARAAPGTTLVFDEVDAGVGGATAAAVGDRLARLARERQVLVVTHSPQVAARGRQHLQVAKAVAGGTTRTDVTALAPAARGEEIARMLSGAAITPEARAAAARLIAEVAADA